MTVVVLDSNSLPHGQFNNRVLDRVIADAGHGASVVVPEVVVWEWAEYAHLEAKAQAESMRRNRVDALLMPRPEIPEVPSIDEFVKLVETALHGRAVIWRAPDPVWRDSVRQQVLQTGNGERKSGVKTGAADAIVLACVQSQLDSTDGPVLLLASDSRLRAACNAVCPDALVANGVGQLLPQLNTFVPVAEDLALRAAEDLPLFFNERLGDGEAPLNFSDLGVEYRSGTIRLGPRTDPRLTALHLSRVDIAEVDNFRIAVSDSGRYGLAELRIFGDIAIEIVEEVEVDSGQLVEVSRVIDVSTAHIDVTVAIRWSDDWRLEGIEPTGVAVAVQSTFEELDELDDYAVPAFVATAIRSPVTSPGD